MGPHLSQAMESPPGQSGRHGFIGCAGHRCNLVEAHEAVGATVEVVVCSILVVVTIRRGNVQRGVRDAVDVVTVLTEQCISCGVVYHL